ncbi:MAG: hypothetical protein ACLUVC_01170 [Longibaculum sp.]
MLEEKDIINKAKEAYESHFKDIEEKTDDAFRGGDVTLDKDKLEKEVKEKVIQEEKKHESLEVLREKITEDAEESLKNAFGEEKEAEPKEKMNTEEMYEELNKEKEHLTKMVEEMKEEKLAGKK